MMGMMRVDDQDKTEDSSHGRLVCLCARRSLLDDVEERIQDELVTHRCDDR